MNVLLEKKLFLLLGIFQKQQAYHLYVTGDVDCGLSVQKNLFFIFRKNEAFHLYVSKRAALGNASVKTLYCIFHKHEAFHQYVSGDVD